MKVSFKIPELNLTVMINDTDDRELIKKKYIDQRNNTRHHAIKEHEFKTPIKDFDSRNESPKARKNNKA